MLLVTRRPDVALSPRELEVADLLGIGLTAKEIAGRLGISVWTVRHHLERARLRFGAKTTHELGVLLARGRASRAREEPRTA